MRLKTYSSNHTSTFFCFCIYAHTKNDTRIWPQQLCPPVINNLRLLNNYSIILVPSIGCKAVYLVQGRRLSILPCPRWAWCRQRLATDVSHIRTYHDSAVDWANVVRHCRNAVERLEGKIAVTNTIAFLNPVYQ